MILDEKPHTIVAVTAPLMGFIDDMVEVFVPFKADQMITYPRNTHYLTVLGRLKPTVSFDQAQAQMSQLSALIEQEHPQSNINKRAGVKPLHDSIVSRVRTAFFVLYGAVTFLMVIACMNVSNLLTAKASARHHETAIRRSLGAGRFRVFRQFLTESLLLGLLGGLLGLGIAWAGLDLLRWIAPSGIPGLAEIGLNLPVLKFTLVLAVGTSVLFGLLPAWHGTAPDVYSSLKIAGGRLSSTRKRHRSLSILVVAQLSLALVLLAGAGLLIKSFARLQLASPGFHIENVLAVNLVRPASENNRSGDVRKQFFQEVTRRLGDLPGVAACATVDIAPMANYGNTVDLRMYGRSDNLTTEVRVITPDYFTCLDIPLRRGRVLRADDGHDGLNTAVVNEAFVQRYLGDQNPLGLTFTCWDQTNTIVGVVGNVKLKSLRQQGFAPIVYLPMTQHCGWDMTVLLRSEENPLSRFQSIRQTIWDVDPGQPIMNISTMNDIIRQSYAVERFCTILLTVMAGVALVMAMAGLYGIMSFAVNERHNEIGIRMALGAGNSAILTLVARKALILTLIGLGIGFIGAWVVSELMGSMLYDISSHDLATFVVVPLFMSAMAMLACWIPARRAAKIDPMEALRYE
jgi:predicted permease